MVYISLAIGIGMLSVLLLYFGLRMVLRTGWLLGFIRGCCASAVIVMAVLVGLAAYDIYSYQQLNEPKVIATLSTRELAPQEFEVNVLFDNGQEQRFELKGDQWQVDARIIRWPEFGGLLRLKPGFRLDRISGRYYALGQERDSERSVHSLHDSLSVDIWALLQNNYRRLSLQRTTFGSATFMPMVDDGLYEISLSANGLAAKPLNEKASEALNQWR
ncbi:hypothetical protein [Pseudoteredinibacter isoporae]|uniref:hypothetical protein n=1 Tax=Pseudoteredinibacter isoporae TaxID=570281 RepID=UPI003102EA85